MQQRFLTFVQSILFAAVAACSALGQTFPLSPVDRTQSIEFVRGDFGLVDGAAANGNVLYVPDVKAKHLFAYRPTHEAQPWLMLASNQGGFSGTFFQLGELYLSDSSGGRILKSDDGKQLSEWAVFADDARPNDLVVDHVGNVFVTITKQGEVRWIRPDGTITTVLSDIETPNGIAVSPDGGTLYVSLYKPGRIVQAAIERQADEIRLGEPTDFAHMDGSQAGAMSDGMTIDRAGNIYCAGAQSVWIWNADGKLLDKIVTPERPINATFGGPEAQDLYISTFGGLLRQPMLVSGVSPNTPMPTPLANIKNAPSTAISAALTADLNQVYYQEGSRKLLCDLFAPNEDAAGRPAIVLVHGGGWLKGDKTKFRPLALRIAERGYVVMCIEYRLGQEAHFPAAIHDCNAATLYLRSNAAHYNVDPDRIAAVGGSAGGHLVGLMATGSDITALQPPGQVTYLTPTSRSNSSHLKAAVVMAGPMQIASGSVAEKSKAGMSSNATQWLGKNLDEAPELYRLADAYEKISADDPAMLFITGSLDNPSRDEPSLQRLKSVGITASQVIHEGATHGHWNRAEWMPQVVEDICSFFDKQL